MDMHWMSRQTADRMISPPLPLYRRAFSMRATTSTTEGVSSASALGRGETADSASTT